VQLFGCHSGPNQQWEMKQISGNIYQVVNKNSAKCLDVAGGSKSDGGNIQQFGCHGVPNQQWMMTPLVGDYSQFMNQNSGKCLDVAGGSKNDGANIQQFSCHGGPSQKFKLQSSASSPILIKPRGVEAGDESKETQVEPQPRSNP
jgi:hypothetical protein